MHERVDDSFVSARIDDLREQNAVIDSKVVLITDVWE